MWITSRRQMLRACTSPEAQQDLILTFKPRVHEYTRHIIRRHRPSMPEQESKSAQADIWREFYCVALEAFPAYVHRWLNPTAADRGKHGWLRCQLLDWLKPVINRYLQLDDLAQDLHDDQKWALGWVKDCREDVNRRLQNFEKDHPNKPYHSVLDISDRYPDAKHADSARHLSVKLNRGPYSTDQFSQFLHGARQKRAEIWVDVVRLNAPAEWLNRRVLLKGFFHLGLQEVVEDSLFLRRYLRFDGEHYEDQAIGQRSYDEAMRRLETQAPRSHSLIELWHGRRDLAVVVAEEECLQAARLIRKQLPPNCELQSISAEDRAVLERARTIKQRRDQNRDTGFSGKDQDLILDRGLTLKERKKLEDALSGAPLTAKAVKYALQEAFDLFGRELLEVVKEQMGKVDPEEIRRELKILHLDNIARKSRFLRRELALRVSE